MNNWALIFSITIDRKKKKKKRQVTFSSVWTRNQYAWGVFLNRDLVFVFCWQLELKSFGLHPPLFSQAFLSCYGTLETTITKTCRVINRELVGGSSSQSDGSLEDSKDDSRSNLSHRAQIWAGWQFSSFLFLFLNESTKYHLHDYKNIE